MGSDSGSLNSVYPVGSIYLSINSTNPSTLFGGTWEQLKDRFLLGAGSIYTAGSTGGAATHTLTVNEMPSHTHTLYANEVGANNGGSLRVMKDPPYESRYPQPSTSAGGNAAHNNMPPYLVVYMWKRTA